MVNSTGKNLNILIPCEFTSHHDWMVFSCWYSIQRNLPDANVKILCKKQGLTKNYFTWARRKRLNFSLCSEINCEVESPGLVLFPSIVVLDELNDEFIHRLETEIVKDNFSKSTKSEEYSSFVDFSDGIGNFKLERWINKLGNPFLFTNKYKVDFMTINEIKVLDLWSQASKTFYGLTKG